jgi:hypothetical protein
MIKAYTHAQAQVVEHYCNEAPSILVFNERVVVADVYRGKLACFDPDSLANFDNLFWFNAVHTRIGDALGSLNALHAYTNVYLVDIYILFSLLDDVLKSLSNLGDWVPLASCWQYGRLTSEFLKSDNSLLVRIIQVSGFRPDYHEWGSDCRFSQAVLLCQGCLSGVSVETPSEQQVQALLFWFLRRYSICHRAREVSCSTNDKRNIASFQTEAYFLGEFVVYLLHAGWGVFACHLNVAIV